MEIHLLRGLQHKNIVQYIDHIMVDSTLNIVMEYGPAPSLSLSLSLSPSLPPSLSLSLVIFHVFHIQWRLFLMLILCLCLFVRMSVCIFFRYVENGSLYGMVRDYGCFPEELCKVYIKKTLQGLVYLHEQGTPSLYPSVSICLSSSFSCSLCAMFCLIFCFFLFSFSLWLVTGVIHRDIKGANILITKVFSLFLSLARSLTHSLTLTRNILTHSLIRF
jgi:serine/threonine protein kinase